MNDILDDYKTAYFDFHECYPEVTKKGGWVYLGNETKAIRLKDVTKFTERLVEMKKEREIIMKRPMKRGDYITNIPKDAFENSEDDNIIKLLTNIQKNGRVIFRSKNIKECQRLGKEIAKNVKTILNTLEK